MHMLTSRNTEAPQKGSLWYGTSGPVDAQIVLVGESWGFEEAAAERPFVGSSGTELNRILAEAGLERNSILCTNVVAHRPQSNEMWRLFAPKAKPTGLPFIRGLDPLLLVREELSRLQMQIAMYPRKLIIACGNYSLWALADVTGVSTLRSSNGRSIPKEDQPLVPTGIMNWRGSMLYTTNAGPLLPHARPLLPIIHPAAIMRQWELRQVTVHDLRARTRLALADDWTRATPQFWAPPSFHDCTSKLREWIARGNVGQKLRLSEDIETARRLVTCVGLADSAHFAMSIPFIRVLPDKSFESWWTIEEEAEIVRLLRKINSHQNILIEGQNFLYDIQYLFYWFGISPKLSWDSMLAQNVLFPGTPKALDYLSSLYCKHHRFWKEDHKEWNLSGTIESLLVYNCEDAIRTFEVCTAQREVMRESSLTEQMHLKMRIHDLCWRMMQRGVAFDRPRRAQINFELEETRAHLERELLQIIPQDFVAPGEKTPWYRSDKQTRYLYYDRLGFAVQKDRKTGQPTVGKEARIILRKRYPEFGGLFERLRLYGSIENSYNVINSGLDSDFRLRCSYNPGGTETHRLSSSKTAMGLGTNLQNLSSGEEDGDIE